MDIYSSQGFNEFVICLGYRGYMIKEYFQNYLLHGSDVTFDFQSGGSQTVHRSTLPPWKVTLVETGIETQTGGRLARARPYLGDDSFMLTYGDGVADIDLPALVRFHRSHGSAATITAVQPPGRFGALIIEDGSAVERFEEKPRGDHSWINGGFFVLEQSIFDYLGSDETVLEREPLESLARQKKLHAYKHRGFWWAMDTLRDKKVSRLPLRERKPAMAQAQLKSEAASMQGGDDLVCRGCGTRSLRLLADLGMQPLANGYVASARLRSMEPFYPLVVYRCATCQLVQVPEVVRADEIFSDYRYLSGYSSSWLEHAKAYVEKVSTRFALDQRSKIVEIASNDGYLLQFAIQKGFPVLGVEPAANVAVEAEKRGVPTHVAFFGTQTAKVLADRGWTADLMVANNVLAHVPDINDFVAAFRVLLKPEGVATFEFPHLLNMIAENQFDTIYHEHFSYLCLLSLHPLFKRHGLRIFDVERLPTHGGSLRLFVAHEKSAHAGARSVAELESEERDFGLDKDACYASFSRRISQARNQLVDFLIRCSEQGKKVCAYGAAAKGNTLLNFCGVRSDQIRLVADRNPHKKVMYLPGTHIPIGDMVDLERERPDYILILPWNLKAEIVDTLRPRFDCQFVTAIPTLNVF